MWMTAQGCGNRTIGQRLETLDRLARRVGIDPVTATRGDVVAFLALPNSRTGLPVSPATRETYWRDLRAWYDYLTAERIIPTNPMDRIKRPRQPRGVPRPLPPKTLAKITKDARGQGHVLTWILLGALEGLRAAEIAAFRGEQIEDDKLLVTGKGGVTAYLPLHSQIAGIANIYPRAGWWFPSRRHDAKIPHVWPESVSRAIARIYRQHGITVGATHRLRHTFGTILLQNGENIRTVQHLMRHESLNTTARYLGVVDQDATDAIDGLPDL